MSPRVAEVCNISLLSLGCEQEQCEALHEERDDLISQLQQHKGSSDQVRRRAGVPDRALSCYLIWQRASLTYSEPHN